jgi:hypothetical protein
VAVHGGSNKQDHFVTRLYGCYVVHGSSTWRRCQVVTRCTAAAVLEACHCYWQGSECSTTAVTAVLQLAQAAC